MKYNFEKFIKHFSSLGKNIVDKSKELQGQVGMINSDTDLKIFIDENKTYAVFVHKVEFKNYE